MFNLIRKAINFIRPKTPSSPPIESQDDMDRRIDAEQLWAQSMREWDRWEQMGQVTHYKNGKRVRDKRIPYH